MLTFPNAKINIGLRITARRPDGYHDLETVFHPVGLFAGTPLNPISFCDILEINLSSGKENIFSFGGRTIDCPLESNLVFKAARLFDERMYAKKGCGIQDNVSGQGYDIRLVKNLPDGAGLGGGSADASFVLRILNEIRDSPFDEDELEKMALELGADCPVFIRNIPCYAEGVGERLHPVDLGLSGYWCVIVKPQVYVSTKEAFAGVVPSADPERFPLYRLGELPVSEWRHVAVNDFETSIFPNHPELPMIKKRLYSLGAEYASMSGSGSAIFGIFPDAETAHSASRSFEVSDMAWPLLL